MADERLQSFIAAAKAKGASDEFLSGLLKDEGWPARDVHSAFRGYYESATGMSVPVRGRAGEAAREAFQYLLNFLTLATWTTALGSLLFTLIEIYFHDPVVDRAGYWRRYSVSTELAAILVSFPVYLFVSKLVRREEAERPERLESGVRKWLTYFAMLIAAGIVIGDVITFLAFFLRGELTVRFVLKVVTVLAIAGGVFMSLNRPVAWLRLAATAVVAGALALGFWNLGGRDFQRSLEADSRRVQDIQRMAREVYERWRVSSTLPEKLAGNDPVTGQPYVYRPLTPPNFQLCATFAAESDPGWAGDPWKHPAGQHCFALDARVWR